ncbi:MAG: hypothetical protein EON60_03105 [Alphaproteobacteria bacterium]|nr:MAG: hypothetical protein EON60_03105 [Alphaproteobacteria bacterium]
MIETNYKYDGVFEATDAQVSLLSKLIYGIKGPKNVGEILLSKQHIPFHSNVDGPPKPVGAYLYAFRPAQVRHVVWQQRKGREELSITALSPGLWHVRYRGTGSFNGAYYKVLLEALPSVNPCAAICLQLMLAANGTSGNPMERRRIVITAAKTLVSAPTESNGLTLIPPGMAARLAVMPTELLAAGIRTLRGHLAPQRPA